MSFRGLEAVVDSDLRQGHAALPFALLPSSLALQYAINVLLAASATACTSTERTAMPSQTGGG